MVSPAELRFGKDIDGLDISDIEILVKKRVDESHNLEFKEPSSNFNRDCDHLAKTISGFLNTGGGILLYGVGESADNDHSYPTGLSWCDVSKESLENILKSKVQPWKDEMIIKRIENKENEQKGVFVIEVPKSNTPPHMSNHRYFQRLNFQTVPMSHENVFRAFQASWIRKRELYQNIVEPLYSEIKINCEKVERYEPGIEEEYSKIMCADRYLYDQIDRQLQKKIDEFYQRMMKLNMILGWTGHQIAAKIINKELCKTLNNFKDQIQDMTGDHLKVSIEAEDLTGSNKQIKHHINEVLFQKTTIIGFLKPLFPRYEILKFTPYYEIGGNRTEIPLSEFNELWKRCEAEAAKNPKYLYVWNELPEILTFGRMILKEMLHGSV